MKYLNKQTFSTILRQIHRHVYNNSLNNDYHTDVPTEFTSQIVLKLYDFLLFSRRVFDIKSN